MSRSTHVRIVHSYLLSLLSPSQSAFRFNPYLLGLKVPLPNFNTRSKRQQIAAVAQLLCAYKFNSNSSSGRTSSTTNSKQYPVQYAQINNNMFTLSRDV